MKKLLCSFLILALMLFSGCGEGSSEVNSYRDENGNFIIEDQGSRTVMVKELPSGVPYNGKEFQLSSVSFYQNISDFSYNLFIVICLDVSSLSESEVHWLRESDLSVDAYITNEGNEYDFSSASNLGSILFTDTNELIFVKTSSFAKENRYSFEGSEVTVSISVKQEETYEYKGSDGEKSNLNMTEKVSYNTVIGDSIPDAETIEKPLYDYVTKWLYSKAQSLK